MPKKSFYSNISWIFAGNVIHAVLSFAINIVVARILTQNDFGIINYISSWIAFFSALASMGINNVINKYLSDDIEESNEYLFSAIVVRAAASLLSIVCLILVVFFLDNQNSTIVLISIIQSLSLLFSIGDTFVYWFRLKKEANIVAILRVLSFLLSSIIKLGAIVIKTNIYVYTVAVVLEPLLFSLFLFSFYQKKWKRRIVISKNKIPELIKMASPFILSNVLVIVYSQTDKVMLRQMLGNDAVAIYSVATTIAGIISIIASSVIEGFRPELFHFARVNKEKYYLRLRQLYSIIFWLCICYSIFVTIFSKDILLILYGEKYLSSHSALSLIVWYTSFSYFGAINSIYMIIENKSKWVQINCVIGAFCNIVLNLLLIPVLGVLGAAMASLITQFVANFLLILVNSELRPLIKHIVKGVLFIEVFASEKD